MKQVAVAAIFAGWSFAQAVSAAPRDAQLDFLAGEWEIRSASGAVIGSARIELEAPCAMLHEIRRVGDEPDQPLWFSKLERNGHWSQLFVGARGSLREFTARSAPGAWPMILGGDVILKDGSPARFRLTLWRLSDDRTRRLLERSLDGGKSWVRLFDYTYVRRIGAGGGQARETAACSR